MTILRPPSRPSASSFLRGENWFLWAVGGVVVLLVVVMVVVKNFLGGTKEGKPVESTAPTTVKQQVVDIGPGLRYEVLISPQPDKGKKETAKSEPVKLEPVKGDPPKSEAVKSEPTKTEKSKTDKSKPKPEAKKSP